MAFNLGAFAGGLAGGIKTGLEIADKAKQRQLQEEELASKKAKLLKEKDNKIEAETNKLLLESQKSLESYNQEKNKIMTSDKYDEKSRMNAVNNLNRTFQKGMSIYDSMIKSKTSSMTDIEKVKKYSLIAQNINEGLDFSTYGSVELDGKKVNLPSTAIEQITANPNQFGVGEDNVVYFKNKDGDLTEPFASTVSFKGMVDEDDVKSINVWNKEENKYDIFESNREFNNAYNSNPSMYDLDYEPNKQDDTQLKVDNLKEDTNSINSQIASKEEELATAQKLKQNKRINKIKAEIAKLTSDYNKKTNEINKIDGTSSGKASMNKIKFKYSKTNKGSYSKDEVVKDLYDVSINKLIDFSDNTDSKSASTMIAEAGKENIDNMINKSYKENGDEKTESIFIPLLKAESSIGATDLVTNKIYNDKKLSMMNFFLDEEEGGVPLTKKIAKMSEFVNRFKSGTGNKKTIDYIYEKSIKPIEYGLKGKSSEVYEEDWKLATKNFNSKYTSVFSDLPFATSLDDTSVGFEDFNEAIASLQDYINDYDNGFGNLVRDVFGDNDNDVDRFLNNTFPKLQIADMIMNGGEGEILNPIDMMEMVAEGYRAGALGDEMGAEIRRGSKLEELLRISQFIKY